MKEKKGIVILLAILIVVVLGIGLFGIFRKTDNGVNDKLIFICYDGEKSNSVVNKEDCSYQVLEIKASSDNVKLLAFLDEKHYIYEDGKQVKLYNDGVKKTSLKTGYTDYSLVMGQSGLLGVTFKTKSDSLVSYYSVKKDKTIYDSKFTKIEYVSDKYLSAVTNDGKVKLVDTTTNKEYLSENGESGRNNYYAYFESDNYKIIFLISSSEDNGTKYSKVYDNKLKELASNVNYFTESDNNLVLVSNDVINYYNNKLELVKKVDKYKNILSTSEKYIIYNDNGSLKIADMDNDIITLGTISKNEDFVSASLIDTDYQIIVKDSSITINDVWNACTSKEVCEYSSKEELKGKEFVNNYSYNVETGELKKTINVSF